jgi:hypothetical protein
MVFSEEEKQRDITVLNNKASNFENDEGCERGMRTQHNEVHQKKGKKKIEMEILTSGTGSIHCRAGVKCFFDLRITSKPPKQTTSND